jgi:hypothetical protein
MGFCVFLRGWGEVATCTPEVGEGKRSFALLFPFCCSPPVFLHYIFVTGFEYILFERILN